MNVGNEKDPSRYPRRQADQAVLLSLLRLKRTDLLERFITYYQEQYGADYHNERWSAQAANAFATPDPAFKPLLDEWVASSPNAFAAWLARGFYHRAVASHMRGTNYVSETSRAQMMALDEHTKLSQADLLRALELRPELMVARHEGRNAEALERLNRAAKVDPQNTYVLRKRYDLLTDNKDYLTAARDLIVLRHLEPTDKWVADCVVWLVKMLKYQGNQLYKVGKNAEAAPHFQLGLELDPDNSELMARQGRAASDSVETLLAEAEKLKACDLGLSTACRDVKRMQTKR